MDRIIRFYRIVDREQQPFPNEFPLAELQDEIVALSDQDAYITLNRMELLGSSWKPRPGAGARRQVALIALDRITRDPQLRIERRRHYRPLVLGDGENLADPTFYSIFDGGVLAVLRTSNLAPGPASFRDYVNYLEVVKPEIAVVPLIDGNALRALSQIGTLTRMTFGVGPDVSPDTFQTSPLIFDVIRGMRQSLGSVSIEVSVKIAPRGQHAAAEEAQRQLSNLVTSEAIGYADKAQVKYRRLEDGKAATHDFIEEAITHTAVVETDADTKQPVDSSVAEAMAAAYDDLYDDIRSALRPAA